MKLDGILTHVSLPGEKNNLFGVFTKCIIHANSAEQCLYAPNIFFYTAITYFRLLYTLEPMNQKARRSSINLIDLNSYTITK